MSKKLNSKANNPYVCQGLVSAGLTVSHPITDQISRRKHDLSFPLFRGHEILNNEKSRQWNPDRRASVTSRLDPACWSASFTLCLIRIVTFFNVAPSESRGPLTQNKLNYSYVMLAADWLYFWRWFLNQLNAAYQTWRVSGFLQLHCDMRKT